MPIQSQVGVTVAYAPEITFGTPPASGARFLRRTTVNLNLQKQAFASNEVRPDQQVSDLRHGSRSGMGQIDGEMSLATYDDFFEAALRGTWTAGVTANQATLTNLSTDAQGRINVGGGSLLTAGFRIGDVVRFTGLTGGLAPLTAGNYRITALTATQATVTPPAPISQSAQTTFAITATGRKLLNGIVSRSFSLEKNLPDAATSELYTGARIGGFTLQVPPNGMATVSFDVQSRNAEIRKLSNAPFWQGANVPAAAPVGGVLAGAGGAVRIAGAERIIATGLQLQVTNNLSMQPVIGSNFVPDIFYGRNVVTGSVSLFLEDASLLEAFDQEQEADLVAVLTAAGAAPQDFISINCPRIKLSSAQTSIADTDGVIVQCAFQALRTTGVAGQDATTIAMQRSNA